MIAAWMLIMPTLVGVAAWPNADNAAPIASDHTTSTRFFTVKKLLNFQILTHGASERPSDREPESRFALKEWRRLPKRRNRIKERGLIWKQRTVGHDGGLQECLDDIRVIRPVKTERGVHDRHDDL